MKRGGKAIDDPITWFDSLSKETIDFWEAVYQVCPFGGEWLQTAKMSHLLWKVWSNHVEFDGAPPNYTHEDFMPHGYFRHTSVEPTGITDPIEQQQELCRYFNIPFTG